VLHGWAACATSLGIDNVSAKKRGQGILSRANSETMPLEDFIIWVYILVDDWMANFPHTLRQRGYPPALSHAEVFTLEVVAEYLGYDEDKASWAYFNRHWRAWFPRLPSRSTYVRQCANLWAVKQRLHADLCREFEQWS
jgi:hypothetical protein